MPLAWGSVCARRHRHSRAVMPTSIEFKKKVSWVLSQHTWTAENCGLVELLCCAASNLFQLNVLLFIYFYIYKYIYVKKNNWLFLCVPVASCTPASAPTAAAVSARTICPPPCRVASASVATAWAAASLHNTQTQSVLCYRDTHIRKHP